METTQTNAQNPVTILRDKLTDLEALALSKALSKATSEGISAGVHEVNFKVHIRGTLKKGEDYEQKMVAKADPWTLLAVALSKLNSTTVESLVDEALNLSDEVAKQIKVRADEAISKIKAPTVQTCNGKVAVALIVEPLL